VVKRALDTPTTLSAYVPMWLKDQTTTRATTAIEKAKAGLKERRLSSRRFDPDPGYDILQKFSSSPVEPLAP
jgi:hypothetical protein